MEETIETLDYYNQPTNETLLISGYLGEIDPNVDYSDMPPLVEEVILPDKVQRRLMRPLKEEIRINARSIYDELPILMQDEVKRAEIAVLLAKTDYDRVYKRNLAREKKGRSDESDDGEVKNKLTKYELLNNKEEIYEYYQTCRKYSVTAKHFGISDFLVKKVVSQY